MNFIAENWYLFAVAIVSGALLLWPSLQPGAKAGVPASEAVRLINHEKAVVIDVSEPGQFAALHVGGARSVPLGKLEASPPELPKNKSVPLLVYGVGAGKAVAILKKQGFEKAMQLMGGVAAWQAANLPVEKSA